MAMKVTRNMRSFITLLCLTLSGPLAASRLVYERVGQITAVSPESDNIKIDGASYRLATKVDVHSTEKTDNSLNVHSLQSGAKIGYSLTTPAKDKEPEISSIWLLPEK